MKTLEADADDSQVNGEPVAAAHFADKMDVMFEIHGPRCAAAMVGIAEPDSRIECITGVIEYSDKVSDVHMIVAVRPFGARDGFVTRRS